MIVYQHGEAQFDPQKNAFIIKDNVTKLSTSESLVLTHLITHSGEIVSRETLLEVGWPEKIVVPNSLNVAIANLRKAFRHKAELIVTIKGCGFMLPENTFTAIELSEISPLILESPTTESSATESSQQLDIEVAIHNIYPWYKKLFWIFGGVSAILWISLWSISWQTPSCLMVNGQKICGNIEKLNLEKLPPLKTQTLLINTEGKLYEKN